MDIPYWQQQAPDTPLFPDVEWSKPEQRTHAGRLGIIGGNKLGFAGVAEAYDVATTAGVGDLRVVLPDALRSVIPKTITDTVFAASNPSGSLARGAAPELAALSQWASGVLMIGDAGRNSETAILYEDFIRDYEGQLVITRDAVDLVKNSSLVLVDRPHTLLVVSFAQLQKLFQLIYYPRVLTFSMQLSTLVETLHKFTITYPVGLMVLHKEQILVAEDGHVVTQIWPNPMAIWRGNVAARAAVYWLWHPGKQLEAITTSLLTS